DGIRADLVTGVQTCALPISLHCLEITPARRRRAAAYKERAKSSQRAAADGQCQVLLLHLGFVLRLFRVGRGRMAAHPRVDAGEEIGRASCREGGWVGGGEA